jgi:IS605 OrfB family transposase
MRIIAEPFIVARPNAARVRTRLRVSDGDSAVLREVGEHLGSLAGQDLARRCRDGSRTDRTERKRGLTARSSSRWAGAITRTSNDQYARARANQRDTIASLRRAVNRIEARLKAPVRGTRRIDGRKTRGYATPSERWQKRRRLDVLTARLARLEADYESGRVSVVRGGRRLARARHWLEAAGMQEDDWRHRWEASRLFITADGESDKPWGNETIRWHPEKSWLEVKLPRPLAHLANKPRGRYRLSCSVVFSHRRDEVSAQVAAGSVRYDITFDPARGRWYLDASWTFAAEAPPSLSDLRSSSTLAVDLNHDHAAAWVVDPAGNPVGPPFRFAVPTTGSVSHRDAQVRHLASRLVRVARKSGCASITVENLNFTGASSRENPRLTSGRSGRRVRHAVAGIPTAKFRNRLVQIAANGGIWVIAVDPAYTSRWGKLQLSQLKLQSSDRHRLTPHDAAAVMIGRRGLGHGRPRGAMRTTSRGTRTLARPPADGRRARQAQMSGTCPSEARQRVTTPEPLGVCTYVPGRTDPSKVPRSRQNRSGGPTSDEPVGKER